MRKSYFFSLIVVLLLLSCQNDQAIRKMAESHEMHSPVNNILTAFDEHNYRYPYSLKELAEFINQCPNLDAESYIVSGDKKDLIRYLLSPKNKYLNAGDTCFFFSPIDGTGSIEYGNVTKIINDPWDYRNSFFHTSFQTRDSHHFSFVSTRDFDKCIEKVLSDKCGLSRITSSYKEGNWSEMPYESVPDKTIPLRIVFQAFKDGQVKLLSFPDDIRELVQTDSIYSIVSASIGNIATNYSSAIQESKFFQHHPSIESVIFLSFVPIEADK